ncbi:MAG: hypothetical protein H6512_14355 [Acidimicrobiia bacterium]|nr:hypothetical protein [Acidimicrobiia bacterium]
MLGRATMLSTTPQDYETAAMLFRTCRAQGETVRKLIDCLIAAVAVRHEAAILHADSAFSTLARCADIPVHPASTHRSPPTTAFSAVSRRGTASGSSPPWRDSSQFAVVHAATQLLNKSLS